MALSLSMHTAAQQANDVFPESTPHASLKPVATEQAADAGVEPKLPSPVDAGIGDAMRAFGVVCGPPLVLDILALGSVALVVGRALSRPTGRAGRWLWPLAAFGSTMPAVYASVIRPWHQRWGASREECARALPGDELVPDPGIASTRAVTVDASVEAVWPWLAQLGQDRAGFYSYEWLENLAGCRMHNAERIHPEWQDRAVGELLPLHPASGLKVARFEPERVLAIEHWGALVLEPLDERRTRLIARSRTERGTAALVYLLFIEIPHFIMERRMLLGIKQRAERAFAASKTESPVQR